MANKRMFAASVVETDWFLDLPVSAQTLYFHLGMYADDDGFVSSPKRIARMVGCGDDDLNLLATKSFIIPFPNGTVVITDWKINNTLKGDRYHETVYLEEKAMIRSDGSGRYLLPKTTEPSWNQIGSMMVPQNRVVKRSPEKRSIEPRQTEGVEGGLGGDGGTTFCPLPEAAFEKKQEAALDMLQSIASFK